MGSASLAFNAISNLPIFPRTDAPVCRRPHLRLPLRALRRVHCEVKMFARPINGRAHNVGQCLIYGIKRTIVHRESFVRAGSGERRSSRSESRGTNDCGRIDGRSDSQTLKAVSLAVLAQGHQASQMSFDLCISSNYPRALSEQGSICAIHMSRFGLPSPSNPTRHADRGLASRSANYLYG